MWSVFSQVYPVVTRWKAISHGDNFEICFCSFFTCSSKKLLIVQMSFMNYSSRWKPSFESTLTQYCHNQFSSCTWFSQPNHPCRNIGSSDTEIPIKKAMMWFWRNTILGITLNIVDHMIFLSSKFWGICKRLSRYLVYRFVCNLRVYSYR